MFIEFIDQLRCTTPHEDSWLVAAFDRRDERFIVEATLGCPICHRQYRIRDGVAWFGDSHTDDRSIASVHTATDPDGAMRAAAFLNAREQSTLILAGEWASHAHTITALLALRIIALNPVALVADSESVAVVQSSEGIPLAWHAAHGIALDCREATPQNVTTALNVLRPHGRLVAPIQLPVPPEITLLAHDESYWVGEKQSPLITLHRREKGVATTG